MTMRITERLSSWSWVIVFEDDLIVDAFITKVNRFSESLKERLSLDRRAAVLFKEATRKDLDWESKRLKRLSLRSNLLIDVSSDNHCHGSIPRKLSYPDVCSFDLDPIVLDFSTYLTKEVISIKKAVTLFIKECLKLDMKRPNLSPLPHLFKNFKFSVDIIPFQHNIAPDYSPIRTFPPEISIISNDGEKYIDEVVESSDSPGIISLGMPERHFKPLLYYNHFQIPEEILYDTLGKDDKTPPIWCFKLEDVDTAYFSFIKDQFLDENLQKGVQYRVESGFMADSPTFKEFESAFELTISQQMPLCPLPDLKLLSFHSSVSTWDSDPHTEETITDTELMLDVSGPGHHLTRLYSSESYIIRNEQCRKIPNDDCNKDTDLALNEFTINITKLDDSNIKICEKTLMSADTERLGSNDTIEATRMTSIIQPDETLESKRSIDNELEVLMAKKRRNISHSNQDFSTFPILKLLKTHEVSYGSNQTETQEENFIIPQLTVPPTGECTQPFNSSNTVLFNMSHINHNSQIINYLMRCSDLQMIEYDMFESGPDFLISSSSGILIFKSSEIGQVEINGDLTLHPRIIINSKTLNRLHVIIEGVINKEIVFNFQLALSLMNISSVVVDAIPQSVSDEILTLAYFDGHKISEQDLELIEDISHRYLISCGINPFAALDILKQVDILELHQYDQKKLNDKFSGVISEHIIDNIFRLFTLQWSMVQDHQSHPGIYI